MITSENRKKYYDLFREVQALRACLSIAEQLEARKNRNWERYDQLDEMGKIEMIFDELNAWVGL